MKRKAISIALVLVLVVLAAGCGSKKKAASSTTTAAATTTSAATTTAAATTTTEGTTTSNSGGGGTPSFASAKNCLQLASIGKKFSEAAGANGSKTPDYDKEISLFKAFADAAPSDIKPDFETLASAFSGYIGALKKIGYTPGSGKVPSAKQIAALTAAAKSFSDPKLAAAEKNITAWGQKNCAGFTGTN